MPILPGRSLSTRPRPSSRHMKISHPQEYTDLSTTDLLLLAPLFTSSSPFDLKQKISSLPLHLTCKLPRLSTFCPRHAKINPLPILSLLDAIGYDLDDSRLSRFEGYLGSSRVTVVLQDSNALWMRPGDFEAVYCRPVLPAYEDLPRCGGCRVEILARDVRLLQVVGGVVLAGMKVGKWKKSKRVRFLEELIRARVGFGYEEEKEEEEEAAVLGMWESGVQLKNAGRERVDWEREWRRKRREYVDQYVRLAKGEEGTGKGKASEKMEPPTRPARESRQADHVEFSTNVFLPREDAKETHVPPDPFVDKYDLDAQPVGRRTPRPSTPEAFVAASNTPKAPARNKPLPPIAASSIYSVDENEHDEFDAGEPPHSASLLIHPRPVRHVAPWVYSRAGNQAGVEGEDGLEVQKLPVHRGRLPPSDRDRIVSSSSSVYSQSSYMGHGRGGIESQIIDSYRYRDEER